MLGDGWIGQVPLWGQPAGPESKSEARRVPLAVSRVRTVHDGESSSLPRVRVPRDQRKPGTDDLPRVRKAAERRLKDDLEPLTVALEDGVLTIRSDGMPVRVKPRPRTTQTGHVYMPADYMTWKRTIAGKVAFRLQECPVFRQGRVRLDLWIWSGKGDVDNLAGGVMDALNGIAWRDDDQITDLTVRKRPRTKTAPRWMAIVQAATDA